jgi:hypothetical protein
VLYEAQWHLQAPNDRMSPVRPRYVPPLLYDKHESASLILRDGSTALIRLADQNDAIPMQEFVGRLSPESKHHRFFSEYSFRRSSSNLVRLIQSLFSAHVHCHPGVQRRSSDHRERLLLGEGFAEC